QAEDGIRDFHVTGVQTCALPIYIGRSGLQEQQSFTLEVRADDAAAQQLISGGVLAANAVVAPADVYSMPTSVSAGKDHSAFDVRSEERRGGKEYNSSSTALQ